VLATAPNLLVAAKRLAVLQFRLHALLTVPATSDLLVPLLANLANAQHLALEVILQGDMLRPSF
jgi:hypothetical protein